MPSSPGYKTTKKFCEVCKTPLKLKNARDLTRKRFCSASCRGYLTTRERFAKLDERTCVLCGISFKPTNHAQVFCSASCCSKAHIKSTDYQYSKISGDWGRYFSRLVAQKDRAALSVEMLRALFIKQDGLCAISGVPMTCLLERGVVAPTNASIDRIKAGGPYTIDNIQLVCRHVNTMKWTLTEDELLWWAEQIVNSKRGL